MKTAAQLKADIQDIRDKQDAEIKQYEGKPMPEDVMAQCVKWDGELETLLSQYSEQAQNEKRAASNRHAMQQIFVGDSPMPQPTGDGQQAKGLDTKQAFTLGDLFLSDPQFKSWLDNMTSGGTRAISDTAHIASPAVPINKSIKAMHEMKTLVTGLSSTSGGALVVNDRLPTIVPAVRDELTILDLVTHQTTNSDTVEYVRVGTETNNAAAVLEATSASDGAKPESATALSVVTAIVETIAHWIPITRRAASDAPQLMAYINDFLVDGLRRALNTEIIGGSGTTPHLRGIANTSGIQTQAYSTGLLETTRKARTLVKTVGGAVPSAYAMDPADWESIDLLTDNENRYYFGGPGRMGTPVLWGLPVVEDLALTAGTAYVADWSMAIVWDREQARLLMTDSHSDYFIRNILVVLAELRAAFGILRPAAFVQIDLTP